MKNEIGCKVRSVELNVLQRCAAHASSLTDIEEAFLLGKEAVRKAAEGHTSKMVILTRTSNAPYTVEYGTIDVAEVANHEKKIPREWINEAGNDVTEELVEYIRPLIMGEPEIPYVNGIPQYMLL